MIILDTNVVSELAKPSPAPEVMRWLDDLDPSTAYLTSITIAELYFGVDRLPEGARKQALAMAVNGLVEQAFRNRTLTFDRTSAACFGSMVADAQRRGVQVTFPDGAIAAIARANGSATIATRGEGPFRAMGIRVVNPWRAA